MASSGYLFDLDWTILAYYFYPRIYRKIIRHYKLQGKLNEDELRALIYKHSRELFNKGFYLESHDWDIVLEKILEKYDLTIDKTFSEFVNEDVSEHGVDLKPGAIDVLKYIKSKRGVIGVLTNGFRKYQLLKVKKSKIEKYVDFIIYIDDAKSIKPHKSFFQKAINETVERGTQPRFYVGDNLFFDVIGAMNAGIGNVIWYHEDYREDMARKSLMDFQNLIIEVKKLFKDTVKINNLLDKEFWIVKNHYILIEMLKENLI